MALARILCEISLIDIVNYSVVAYEQNGITTDTPSSMWFARHITTVTICNIDNFTIQKNILQIRQKPSPIP